MAEEELPKSTTQGLKQESKAADKAETKERREIKGNLPYTAYPGSLKSVLEAILVAERPEKFSTKFLETVLKSTGGGARSVPPFLKKMGFLEGDGTPTDRYSRFKTVTKRGQAAAEGLRSAFSELFKRNEFIDKASDEQIKDLIVEITGLNKSDPIIRLIFSAFDTVRGYVPSNLRGQVTYETVRDEDKQDQTHTEHSNPGFGSPQSFGISYQINIVLPETDDPMVFDAIFKSLKRNLLH